MEAGASREAEYTLINIDSGLRLARHVRMAPDSASRRKGLLGVHEICLDSGLWIAPCEAIHTFGMKIPIDVLFLDGDFKVKKLRRQMPPWRISVCLPASSVVEMRAGVIAASNTKVGDRLSVQRTGTEDALTAAPVKSNSICPPS
jgi:hypothetical protein